MNVKQKQHELLNALNEHRIKFISSQKTGVTKISEGLPWDDMMKVINVNTDELMLIHSSLVKEQEIIVNNFQNPIGYQITAPNGLSSLNNKKYLKESNKDFNDGIYDVIKWVLPLCLIIVTIVTTCVNMNLSKDKMKTQQQIDKIEEQINTLQKSGNALPEYKLHHYEDSENNATDTIK